MEFKTNNSFGVQDAFHDLLLKENEGVTNVVTDIVLIGKVLAGRMFKHSIVKEIINNMWHTREKVTIEGLTDNVFKFTFKLKEDMKLIFSKRPSSVNGVYLVLKEWMEDAAMKEVSFATSTFNFHIHRLPP